MPCKRILMSSSVPPVTILVAESLPDMRSLLVHIFQREGCHVLEASTATEAVQVAGNHPGPIPLLMTGMTLPEMTGETLGRLLAACCPGLRTLCLSGLPHRHLVEAGIL